MRAYILLPLLLVILTVPVWADRITIDGQTHTGVLVRETRTMVYVQFPTGELRSIPKSAGTVSDVERTSDAAERERLHDAWRAARGETLHAPDATREERYPLAIAAVRDALAKADEPIVLRLKGTKKPVSADEAATIPAELVIGDETFPMDLNPDRLAQALKIYAPEQSLDAAVRNGTIHLTRDARAQGFYERPQTRYYDVTHASGTLPKVALQNPGGTGFGGGGGGFQGGGAGGFQGGGAGGVQGGAGGAGGFGGAGFGGPQIFNISQLFFTIDDRMVGETLNPISAMYGVR